LAGRSLKRKFQEYKESVDIEVKENEVAIRSLASADHQGN